MITECLYVSIFSSEHLNCLKHQVILPENINLGTGIIMGLSSTIAGAFILVFGKLADIYGLMEMAQITACLGLITVFMSFYISKKYDLAIVKPTLAR